MALTSDQNDPQIDELASARQWRDDLRQLKERYPEITTPTEQDRVTAYMSTQTDDVGIPTERKERPMPAKGQRGFGEDLVPLTVRIPKSDMAFIDQHVQTLQRLHRYTRQGRSEAARDLIQKGIDSIENPPQLPRPMAPPVEPAATTAGGAIPPAPAYEARSLTPEVDDVPRRRRAVSPLDQAIEEMPLEPPVVTQASPAPSAQTEDVRPARSRRAARPTGNPTVPIKPKRASRAQKGD